MAQDYEDSTMWDPDAGLSEDYSEAVAEIADWWGRGLLSTRELGDRLRRLGQEPL